MNTSISDPSSLLKLKGVGHKVAEKLQRLDIHNQEDLLFHLAIAKASGNSSLETLMLTITPEIITNFEEHHVCDENQKFLAIKEHKTILEAIEKQDTALAKESMKEHFKIKFEDFFSCFSIL